VQRSVRVTLPRRCQPPLDDAAYLLGRLHGGP
jgi:hypothetical protein